MNAALSAGLSNEIPRTKTPAFSYSEWRSRNPQPSAVHPGVSAFGKNHRTRRFPRNSSRVRIFPVWSGSRNAGAGSPGFSTVRVSLGGLGGGVAAGGGVGGAASARFVAAGGPVGPADGASSRPQPAAPAAQNPSASAAVALFTRSDATSPRRGRHRPRQRWTRASFDSGQDRSARSYASLASRARPSVRSVSPT